MEALDNLEQSILQLLERYQQLQQDYQLLQQKNAEQREEILRTHSELRELQLNYKHLQEAAAMMGDTESRDAAKRHLTQLILQIDNALEVLKQ